MELPRVQEEEKKNNFPTNLRATVLRMWHTFFVMINLQYVPKGLFQMINQLGSNIQNVGTKIQVITIESGFLNLKSY